MPNTSNFSLPYPQSSDTPDVPRDMLALAGAVDTKLLQTVRVFATTAARDAAITSPTAGMVCYVDSGDASEGLYTYQGAAWRKGPGWNAPWGIMTAPVANTTTDSAITSQKVTITSGSFTAVANRYYRLTYVEPQVSNSNTDNTTMRIRLTDTAGTAYQSMTLPFAQTGTTATVVTTLAAGSTVIVATLQAATGTSTATRSATSPAQLIIEDIGPSGAPA